MSHDVPSLIVHSAQEPAWVSKVLPRMGQESLHELLVFTALAGLLYQEGSDE
jgi:hypothetical protein